MSKKARQRVQRGRASYLTNGVCVNALRVRTGMTALEFVTKWEGEGKKLGLRTLTKAESGKEEVSAASLKILADMFSNEKDIGRKVEWSELLADSEKARLQIPDHMEAPNTSEGPAIGHSLTAVTPVSDFVGRAKDQADILAHLKGGGRVCISAIKAAGGMGKTQLAAKCVEQLREAYQHVLWLRLDGMTTPKKPESLLQDVIRYFHPTDKLPETVTELVPLYLTVLHGLRVLIVLDNAKDEAQVTPLLDDAVPAGTAFIVTSRNKLRLPNARLKNLEELGEAEALDLLRTIIREQHHNFDDPQLAEVAERCGHLPLALRVAGTYLRDHHNLKAALPKYLRDLANEPLEHLKLGTDADKNVHRVLSLSVRQLVDDNPEQAERFQMLSVFPGDFAADAAASVWNLDPDETFTALDDLIDRSLVEFDTTTDRYHLHDLMRPVAREAFEVGGTPQPRPLASGSAGRILLAEHRFALHYLMVLARIGDLEKSKEHGILAALKLFDAEEDNIRHGQAWAARRFEANPNDRMAAEMVAQYPCVGVYAADLRLSVREVKIPWLTLAATAAKRLGQKEWEGHALSILGNGWFATGDARKAIEYHEQALTVSREIGDRRGEGPHLNNLGGAWAALGVASKAIAFFESALEVACGFGDRRTEGQTLNNLGSAWFTLGDAKKAIGYQERALAVVQEIGDRRTEGQTLNNLGVAWTQLGDTRKAITFYEQRLVIAREIGDRRGEGTALGNLGIVWADLKDVEKAIEYYQQRLAIVREMGDRQGEAEAFWNMAIALASIGRRDEAIPLAEVSLQFYAEIGHPHAEMIRQQIEQWKSAPSG